MLCPRRQVDSTAHSPVHNNADVFGQLPGDTVGL
jgi:hypothetical protein